MRCRGAEDEDTPPSSPYRDAEDDDEMEPGDVLVDDEEGILQEVAVLEEGDGVS